MNTILLKTEDRVSFGQRIVVGDQESSSDLVCILCSVEIHGNVKGDVVSLLGGVKNDGAIHGDLVSLLGDVNLTGPGSVDGDVVVVGGNLHKTEATHLGSDQVVLPPSVFLIPFVILAAILWGLIHVFRRRPTYFTALR